MRNATDLSKNYDIDVLNSFKAWKVGLLDPEGKLVSVQMYGHFEELKKYSEFRDAIEQFEDSVADAEYDFVSRLEPDEHPGWHSFECWKYDEEDRLRQEILQKAYDLGWARVGLVLKRPKPHLLELETSEKNVAKLKRYAEDIAELLDANLIVTNVDKFKYY